MHVIHHLLPQVAGATLAVGVLVTSARLLHRPNHAASVIHSTDYQYKPSPRPCDDAQQLVAAAAAVPAAVVPSWLQWRRVHQVLLIACFLGASLTLLTEASTYMLASTAAAALSVAATAGWYYTGQPGRAEAPSPKQQLDRNTLTAAAGTWVKDGKRSSSMEPFFTLFAVSALLRKAAILMRGFEIEVEGDTLVTRQLCALPWFTVVERFPLDGTTAPAKRRDMRSGQQHGRLVSASEGEIVLRVDWGAPMAGFAVDTLQLVEGGAVLRHQAHAQVGDRSAEFVATYQRKGS